MTHQRRAGWIVTGAALCFFGAGCDLKPPAPEPDPPPVVHDAAPVPIVAPEVVEDEGACPRKGSTRLVVKRGDETLIDAVAETEIRKRGGGDLTEGSLKGRVGVSAKSIASGAKNLELVPCDGDPIVIPATERFFFTVNQRGIVKVVDMDDQGKRIAKNLAEIRLLDK